MWAEVCDEGSFARRVGVSGPCQSAAPLLGLGVSEFVCIVCKCSVSVFYSPLALLTIIPAGFQNQVPVSRVGVLEVGTEPLAPLQDL